VLALGFELRTVLQPGDAVAVDIEPESSSNPPGTGSAAFPKSFLGGADGAAPSRDSRPRARLSEKGTRRIGSGQRTFDRAGSVRRRTISVKFPAVSINGRIVGRAEAR
jgi:hypothetical protein